MAGGVVIGRIAGARSLVEEAANGVLVSDPPQARLPAITGAGHEVRAARMEGAPRGPVIGVRHGAEDRGQALSRARAKARDGAQERTGIRMPRGMEDLV